MDHITPINIKDIIHERSSSKINSPNGGDINVASWFVDEKIELNFGEYTGRPSANITMHKEYIVKFLENGWKIDAVMEKGETGRWTTSSSSRSSSENYGTTKNTSESNYLGTSTSGSNDSSKSNSTSSSKQDQKEDSKNTYTDTSDNTTTSQSNNTNGSDSGSDGGNSSYTKYDYYKGKDDGSHKSNSSSSNWSENHSRSFGNTTSTSKDHDVDVRTDVTDRDSVQTQDSTSNSSSSTARSSTEKETRKDGSSQNGKTTSDSYSTSSQNADGATYWSAYQKIRLVRRRMQPEKVLDTMVWNFTKSYNLGRSNEDERYNEIVTLYTYVNSRTQNELQNLLDGAMDMNPLIDKMLASIESSLTQAESAATSVSSDALKDALEDVRRNFDALVAQAKSQMISNGTYNTIVWASTMAGIERQREAAIVKARSEGSQISVSTWSNVANIKSNVSSQILAVKQHMSDSLDKRRLSATEMRNGVIKWIADFVSQREDVYPELQEFSQMIERMGFSVGAAGNVL